MKVLVADDSSISREIVGKILKQLGYEVILCENGEVAWEKFKLESPEICLIDWEMPEIDGIELCRRITERGSECQKIMLTARQEKEDLIRAMQVGANDYLIKPVEANQLKLRVRVAELNLAKPALKVCG